MSEIFSLSGKTVLVTGASSGFGYHFAGVLAEAGARVVLGARRVDKIQARGGSRRASRSPTSAVAASELRRLRRQRRLGPGTPGTLSYSSGP